MATLASIQALPPGLSRRQDLEPRGTPPLVAIAVAILLYIGISAGAVQARKLSRDRLIAKPLQWTMLLLVVLYPPSIIFYWYRSTESQKAEAIQKYLSYCESIKVRILDINYGPVLTRFRRATKISTTALHFVGLTQQDSQANAPPISTGKNPLVLHSE